MIPVQLIDEILSFKRLQAITNTLITIGIIASTNLLEHLTEMDSIILDILSVIISILWVHIRCKISDATIRHLMNDRIQEENYEIAVMLVDKNLVNPSHIKDVLTKIAEADTK